RLADANGPDSGAAYVFARNGSAWLQIAKLTPSNGAAEDEFGYSVAISGSGERIAIGAPGKDHPEHQTEDSGSVYVFSAEADTWHETEELLQDAAPSSGVSSI